jgi:alkanesulfonate monooxygenase SsuD/methylene tetrahydromethanopterin reductase-like flavin-dependent oxidoreductase (luciferase family)
MTFGATCIPQVPPERLREVARAAEDEGLDELWLWEDCFWGGGIATAAAVLAWTTRLRAGIGVLPVPLIARESIEAGRTAGGRSGPYRVVQYMAAADSADPATIAETILSWAAAGADTVVLHPTSAGQDPLAHIASPPRSARCSADSDHPW